MIPAGMQVALSQPVQEMDCPVTSSTRAMPMALAPTAV